MKKALNTLEAIGNTPIVKLNKVVPDHAADVWVKLEGGNPTGSYKDRMALAIIEGAEIRGDLGYRGGAYWLQTAAWSGLV